MPDFLAPSLELLSSFNFKIALILFGICLVGEALLISVPYLLETIWVLAGFQLAEGVLSPAQLVALVAVAQLGREVGAIALYYVGRGGGKLFLYLRRRFKLRLDISEVTPIKLLRRIGYLSPFTIAFGRLLWLRIPLTLMAGAEGKLRALIVGVFLSSLVYEGVYIGVGAIVGRTTRLEPFQLLPYFLGIMTIIYITFFLVRRAVSRRTNHNSHKGP